MRNLYVCIISIMCTISSTYASTIFVKHNASGANNGTSWANAYTSLSDALSSAVANDSIWVAQGVYKPGDSRNNYFAMKASVDVFGGFAGNETDFNQRNIKDNEVILSGDIGTEGVHTDNCKTIVMFSTATGSSVILDGFTISFSYSSDINWNERSLGGGIAVREGNSPQIRNCTFYMNRTKNGAAVGIKGQWNNKSHPHIVGCTFIQNYAWDKGGCIANEGYANPQITHCTFIGNSSKNSGGAIYSYTAHAHVKQSLFLGNWSTTGGAIYHNGGTGVTIDNSTFVGNYSRGSNPTITSKGLTIRNSVVWGNTARYFADSSMAGQINGIKASYNCIIQHSDANLPGSNNSNLNPKMFDYAGFDRISGTLDDYAQFLTGSPAIDAGNDAYIAADSYDLNTNGNTTEKVPYDVLGNVRIEGSSSDIGAFEGVITPSQLVSLNLQAIPHNNAVELKWSPSATANIAAFKIFRFTANGTWSQEAHLSSAKRSHILSASNGTVNLYKIVAVQANGAFFGYNNTGVAVPTLEQGNAASFNGSNNFLNLPENLLTLPTTSLSMWVKLSASASTDTMMFVSKQFSHALAAVKGQDGNYYLRSQTGNGSEWKNQVTGTSVLPLDIWTHITLTLDNSSFKQQLYINRVLEAELTGSSGINLNSLPTSLGTIIDDSFGYKYFFKGEMDEVAIWNKILTPAEINNIIDKPLDGNENGLEALWHLDETVTGYQRIAYDATSNHYNLHANYIGYVASEAMVPHAPLIDTVVLTDNGVQITWEQSETDILEFYVYRYSDSDKTPKLIATTTDKVYLDTEIQQTAEELFYYISTVDNQSNYSPESVHKSFFYTVQKPDLTAVKNLKESVLLEWQWESNYPGYVHSGFDIYRADTNDIAKAILLKSIPAGENNATDTEVIDSTHYYYWVKALVEGGLESEYSQVDSLLYSRNKPPQITDTIHELKYPYSLDHLELILLSHFSDPEEKALTFKSSLSNENLAELYEFQEYLFIYNPADAPFEVTVTVKDNWGDSVVSTFQVTPVYETEESKTICEGTSYHGFTEEGDYTLELTSEKGCDSIVSLTLTVIPTIYHTEEIEICAGETYEGYSETGSFTRTLASQKGCDSVVTTNLTVLPVFNSNDTVSICAGDNYNGITESGSFVFNYEAVNGCDSTVTVELEVRDIIETTEAVFICAGEEYEGNTETGTFSRVLVAENGCDSTVVTTLTVYPKFEIEETATICYGEEYKTFSTSGVHTLSLTSQDGCDSIVHINLTVNTTDTIRQLIEICEGEQYNDHSESGLYTTVLSNQYGCDSVIITTLNVLPAYNSTESVTICEGSSYKGKSEAGTYTLDYETLRGCDSIVTLELSVNSYFEIDEVINICEGETYKGYDATGNYTFEYTSTSGCDSIVNLQLTVHSPIINPIDVFICSGSDYNGYTQSGTYYDTLMSSLNCDSIIITHLTVLTSDTITETVTICDGDSYNGETEAGVYTFSYETESGCDSVVKTTLLINTFLETTESKTICAGESYLGYETTGQYTITFTSQSGCDSIVTLLLTVADKTEDTVHITINEGETYTVGNSSYTETGVYTDTLINVHGCDSIVVSDLLINRAPVINQTVDNIDLDQSDLPWVINLTEIFSDTESHSISISANTDVNGIVQLSLSDSTLSLIPIGSGTAIVTINATDEHHATTSLEFTVQILGDTECIKPSVTINIDSISCNGGNDGAISLSVSEGQSPYTYRWSTTSTEKDLINVSAGVYTVVVTGDDGCSQYMEVVLTEPENITTVLDITPATCENTDGKLSVTAHGGIEPYTYVWADGNQQNTYDEVGAGLYHLTITDGNNCEYSEVIELNELNAPEIAVTSVTSTTCTEDKGAITIELSGGTEPYSFAWNDGATSQNRTELPQGEYALVVTDANNCQAHVFESIDMIQPTQTAICMVSVNESGNNQVIWERNQSAENVAYYTIYRESTVAGSYDSLASVNYDETSIYVDADADPSVRPWRYKLSAVDACGNESPLSTAHKTMHITQSLGVNDAVNLRWNLYEGKDLYTYRVYRYSTGTDREELAVIPANITSYTDNNPPAGAVQYQVAVDIPSPCLVSSLKSDSGPFSQSLSNLAEAVVQNNITFTEKLSFEVYPNPAKNNVSIHFSETISSGTLSITTSLGSEVFKTVISEMSSISIDVSNLSAQLYTVSLKTDDVNYNQQLIIID